MASLRFDRWKEKPGKLPPFPHSPIPRYGSSSGDTAAQVGREIIATAPIGRLEGERQQDLEQDEVAYFPISSLIPATYSNQRRSRLVRNPLRGT